MAPRLLAGFFTSASGSGGVKRRAALGTSRTFSRVRVVISAVPVMPGRRLRSSLSTASTAG